uniref:WxxW domain-containing protein n=1 Tax=Gasterosteus aculeatus aculeatus TaxID=481459 RepID=A0AAQ4RFY6_GASAC
MEMFAAGGLHQSCASTDTFSDARCHTSEMNNKAWSIKSPLPAIMNKLFSVAILAGLFCASSQRVALDTIIPVDKEFCWTSWYDRDDPSGTGDWELLVDLWTEYPGQICNQPVAIEAVTTSSGIPASLAGNIYTSIPGYGFVCVNNQQKSGSCLDYKVRFLCPCRGA